jgi:2-keto-myo-inositol isomerase
MNLCIASSTLMTAPFAEEIAAIADVGWSAVELWSTKLEKHLETATLDSVRQLFAERNVRPVAAAYQGGLLVSQGAERQAHFDSFRQRLEMCQSLGVPTMLVVADYLQKIDPTSFQRSLVSLQQAAQWAAGYDVRLALEFRGSSGFCSSLDTAIGIVEQVGEKNLGICLDLFHYYQGPSKTEDLERLTNENLFHVQLCDIAGVPRETMRDGDRVLPGDGDFRFEPIVEMLKRINYSGYVSLEVFNHVLWQMKATQVAELCLMAMRRALKL